MNIFKWLLRLAPAVYMSLIWLQSSYASDRFVQLPNSTFDRNLKESLHLVEFAILYLLLVLAFLTRRAGLSERMNIACAVFAAVWGVTDELHQSFVPDRSSSLFDFFKDIIGISISFYLIKGALFKGKFRGLNHLLVKLRFLLLRI